MDKLQKISPLLMTAGYLAFLYLLYENVKQGQPDLPTKQEMLEAIENGAASLTVTPIVQSDN